MLVVYDKKGQVYFAGTGYPEPEGIPYINVEVPAGKYFAGVNVTVEPHQPIFKDIPKSEMEILREEVEALKAQNEAMLNGIASMQ